MRAVGNDILVIPDLHGRPFWREAALGADGRHIVFLGDYADPFPDEGLSPEQALAELEAVISLKREHPDKTSLLLGNHDLQYLWPDFPKTRFDERNARRYASLYRDNRDCFSLIACFQAEHRRVIFTHAGILPGWLEANHNLFAGNDRDGDGTDSLENLNVLWRAGQDAQLCQPLSSISSARGGKDTFGSPVWADVSEMQSAPAIPGLFQVFGHTQQHDGPLITDNFACIDCRRAFSLKELLSRYLINS